MNTAPTTYAIRVGGHLDDHWSAWLGDLDIARNDDGTTTLTVSNADQAQLHGVLARLRDIGAVITELRTADAPRFNPTAAVICDPRLWGCLIRYGNDRPKRPRNRKAGPSSKGDSDLLSAETEHLAAGSTPAEHDVTQSRAIAKPGLSAAPQ